MRNVYEAKKVFIDIQQGVIFNNCISENYPNSDVYGVIITPRCDIDHFNVTTIHYLPIVPFEDWINKDLLKIFQEREEKKILKRMYSTLSQNNISVSILNNNLKNEDIVKAASSLKTNVLSEFEKDLIEKTSIKDHDYALKALKKWKDVKNVIKDLIKGNIREFYLIEDWENPEKFKVILLREINRLTFELAVKLRNGIEEHDLRDHDWLKNNLNKSSDKSNIYFTVAKISSPHIEHLLQAFYYNFGRIGVDDFQVNIDEHLLNETNKIINI